MTKTIHNTQEAFCFACGKSLGRDQYLLNLVRKGYKLYCNNKCKAEEQEA